MALDGLEPSLQRRSGLSSPALVKFSGPGGSSDTNHIVLGYADKFLEGVLLAASVREACKLATR